MAIHWIIDEDVLNVSHEYGRRLQEAFTKAELSYFVATREDDEYVDDYLIDHEFNTFDSYLFYGTHLFVNFFHRSTSNFDFKIYGKKPVYNCSKYMALLDSFWFLNQDYILLPYTEVLRRYQSYTGDYFIRPNTPKAFKAGLLKDVCHQNIADTELCLIASRKDIEAEYRCVIGKNRVIDYSQYKRDGILDCRHDMSESAYRLANHIAKEWNPDIVYTLDIADTAEGPKIVEINGFSTSGLYQCDLTTVFNTVTNLTFPSHDNL